MSIRNKLLILLLNVSLIPLVAYFILDLSFSRIVRNRVQNSLRTALEARAAERLVETIDNYDKTLKMSSQAVRYGLSHYANQVQQSLWSVEIDRRRPRFGSGPLPPRLPVSEELSKEAGKYSSLKTPQGQTASVDFNSHFIHSIQGDPNSSLSAELPPLARLCRDIYSISPESKLWFYTVLNDGTSTLYPSPGFWPYEKGYDLRRESWYSGGRPNTPSARAPRIEPLTGKTVMTVTVPLSDQAGSFTGVIAMDVDLSAILDDMHIPPEWEQGAWKLLVRLPPNISRENTQPRIRENAPPRVGSGNTQPRTGRENAPLPPRIRRGNAPPRIGRENGPPSPRRRRGNAEPRIICCSSFMESPREPNKPSNLRDICDPNTMAEMIDNARQGKPGLVRLPYYGVDSLWAYGSSQRGGGLPILIVPYQRIFEQANYAQKVLFRNNIRSIQIATVLIFIVIVMAAVLAVMRARNVTVPITNLADAAGKLAGGDFGVRVNIATNDELQQLGDVFNQVGPGLYERQRIKQSLELAREIQQNFLPKEDLELDNFDVAGLCRYCDETGGDYYDMLDLRDVLPGQVGLVIGDVSGHGLPAAMLMISTGSILRNNAPRHGENLSAAISELNRHLEKNSETGKFMTLFYGLLDDKDKALSWSSAGHDPAIWYKARSGDIAELPNNGMALGIMDEAEFGNSDPVRLQVGDVVLIGTDGIWEAADTSGRMYGKQRLIDSIKSHTDESAGQIASAVVESVLDFCSGSPQTDDITLLVIKCIK